ncbi:DNA internalization-related competence protein ComEC/Rec2 [Bowmanella denitrificans]|uniref:DNA internalization-related competence protein ComEC/Rec2 n=1 Tax=Bowmanella denitrificans TaxID=366582 RepID=A0ABN0X566_9ALTE
MDGWLFSFMTAAALCLLLPVLPSIYLLPALLFGALAFGYQRHFILSGLLTGLVWMASVGHWQLAWQLPDSKIRQVVVLEGQVESLLHEQSVQRFNLNVSGFDHQPVWQNLKVRLVWRKPDWPVKQGQRVRLAVKLKPPHGSLNLGGFNYQQWLFAHSIRATGYVVRSEQNLLLEQGQSVRQTWLDEFATLDLQHSAWLAALSLGYRGWLATHDWQLVQRTGIAHLIAISGLHLGMVSSFSYGLLVIFLGPVLGRFYPHCNLHKLALSGALLVAFGYAALAGFSLPTARAWLMLAMFVLLLNLQLHWRPRRLLLVCLALFILLFPLSLLTLSFWLSFAAVLIIYLVFWRWPAGRGFSVMTFISALVRMQLALSLLMLPLVAWQFGLVSLVSPLVNLLAVPFVTMLLLPLCLLALLALALQPDWGQWLFSWADRLLEYGLSALLRFDALSQSAFAVPHLSLWIWLCFALALIWLLLPKGLVNHAFGFVLLLPLLSAFLPSRDLSWRIEVVDVGQGLAVLVHRHGRALLYDTGPAYPSGYSAAEGQILPMLRALGITQLDYLLVSHQDNDHAGGTTLLLEQINVEQLLTNLGRCRYPWQTVWQGLRLQVLWPLADSEGSQNNLSCVVKITDGQVTVLLPGDIEAAVERELVARNTLSAQILIAPHHGSATSSSSEFIAAVNPEYVVFSQAYLNRWGFPKQQVQQRYTDAGATLYLSSASGQLRFRIDNGRIEAEGLRSNGLNPWYMEQPK